MSDFVATFRTASFLSPSYAARLWKKFQRERLARQTRQMLSEMDNHALSDIGASRCDAVWEASRPVWDRFRYSDPA